MCFIQEQAANRLRLMSFTPPTAHIYKLKSRICVSCCLSATICNYSKIQTTILGNDKCLDGFQDHAGI